MWSQCEEFLSAMPSVRTLCWMCLLMVSRPPASTSQKSECIKLNPCKCIMEDGSGVINLAIMGGSDGFLERDKPLTGPDGESNPDVQYSFSPCLPFSEPVEFAFECLNVAVCLVTRYQTQSGEIRLDFLNFGMHQYNEFSYDNNSQTLTVTYPASDSSLLHTVARFNCSSSHSVVASRNPESPNLLQISVASPCACPNGCKPQDVGPGTIILIVFSITFTTYFLFGFCALNPVRTPNGIEIIPKENIWCSLCQACVEKKGRKQRKHQQY